MSEHKVYKLKDYKVPKKWKDRAFIDEREYFRLYRESLADPDRYWAERGKRIDWIKP